MRLDAGWGSFVISALTTLVVCAGAWSALSERARIDNEEIKTLRMKVEALERERETSARMDEQIKQIALNVTELRGDVKALDAKVSAGKRR